MSEDEFYSIINRDQLLRSMGLLEEKGVNVPLLLAFLELSWIGRRLGVPCLSLRLNGTRVSRVGLLARPSSGLGLN